MTILILVLSFLALTGTPFCNPFVFMVFHGMGGYTPFDLQLPTVDLFCAVLPLLSECQSLPFQSSPVLSFGKQPKTSHL
jgi:hypothetical protein